jgi:hypothetical protein
MGYRCFGAYDTGDTYDSPSSENSTNERFDVTVPT